METKKEYPELEKLLKLWEETAIGFDKYIAWRSLKEEVKTFEQCKWLYYSMPYYSYKQVESWEMAFKTYKTQDDFKWLYEKAITNIQRTKVQEEALKFTK